MGDGDERKRIIEEIRERRLGNFFYLPGETLNPFTYYEAFNVLVLASKQEAFSIVLLEAGSCGVPCIGFDVGGNNEVIKDGVTGFLVTDNDVAAIAEKILYLFRNPNQRKVMGEEAKRFVKQYHIDRRVEKLERIFEEAVAG